MNKTQLHVTVYIIKATKPATATDPAKLILFKAALFFPGACAGVREEGGSEIDEEVDGAPAGETEVAGVGDAGDFAAAEGG
ncbi:unnamed protein product [Lupinus luteus]|uniref:Uncharacterized protein n=1 Tax=Lupinus luteus TaxID=3873 RepID=A0AAV1XHS2_LUPLU